MTDIDWEAYRAREPRRTTACDRRRLAAPGVRDTGAVVTDLESPGWDKSVQAETSTGAFTQPEERALQVWFGGSFYIVPYPILRQPNVSVMRWIRDAD